MGRCSRLCPRMRNPSCWGFWKRSTGIGSPATKNGGVITMAAMGNTAPTVNRKAVSDTTRTELRSGPTATTTAQTAQTPAAKAGPFGKAAGRLYVEICQKIPAGGHYRSIHDGRSADGLGAARHYEPYRGRWRAGDKQGWHRRFILDLDPGIANDWAGIVRRPVRLHEQCVCPSVRAKHRK